LILKDFFQSETLGVCHFGGGFYPEITHNFATFFNKIVKGCYARVQFGIEK
jgi:hypothetical protein